MIHKSLFRFIPLVLTLAMFAVLVGPEVVEANPGWYDSDWTYRKQITINSANVSGTSHTDFPVLIQVVDSDLVGETQADADDIIFTAADEVTRLDHEIEYYDNSSGNLTAWVKIPTLSGSADTDIYIYYSHSGAANSENATAVWDSNFKMVQHMEESSGGAGAIIDSTTNDNDGTDANTPTFGASGKADGAIGFDGAQAEYVDFGDTTSLNISGDITIEAWVYPTASMTSKGIVSKLEPGQLEYQLWINGSGNAEFRIFDAVSSFDWLEATGGSLTTDTWNHVVGVYDMSNLKIYVNGSLTTGNSFSSSIANTTAKMAVANYGGYSSATAFTGTIDEVRVSDTYRGQDWITTTYNNLNAPGDFLTFGAEETETLIPTVTTSAATSVEEETATLNGNITATGGENADTRGFEYDIDSGAPYSANWTESGSFGTGTFNNALSGLTKGELYYFRAIAHNSAGWGTGSELTFLTKPDEPTAMSSTGQGDNWIALSWTNGAGSQNTMVRYALSSYPTSPTDGAQGYYGAGTTVNVTGLSPGLTYYFRAWSYATEGSLEQWSDNYTQVSQATTGTSAPVVIGGFVLPVNKASLLAPWVGLGLIAALLITRLFFYLRKRARSRP